MPEFTWEYFSPGKNAVVDIDFYRRAGFDLVMHIDGGNWCTYIHRSIPVVYYSIDSTLSENHHFAPRFAQAERADLVLIDHDSLDRFKGCGRPVRRWLYCVNDHLFQPGAKTLDVDFQCGGSPERSFLRLKLDELCHAQGLSYKSGVRPLPEYAETMGAARVVIVLPRNAKNRPHRIFDAMASGAAVVSYNFPCDPAEHLQAGTNYFDAHAVGVESLGEIIRGDYWHPVAELGLNTVRRYHTWTTRAAELRAILAEELKL